MGWDKPKLGGTMPSINIQAPMDQVFGAMCDLTRHAKWAAHDINIEAGQEGPPAVGNTYTSSHQGKTPDRLTVRFDLCYRPG